MLLITGEIRIFCDRFEVDYESEWAQGRKQWEAAQIYVAMCWFQFIDLCKLPRYNRVIDPFGVQTYRCFCQCTNWYHFSQSLVGTTVHPVLAHVHGL